MRPNLFSYGMRSKYADPSDPLQNIYISLVFTVPKQVKDDKKNRIFNICLYKMLNDKMKLKEERREGYYGKQKTE